MADKLIVTTDDYKSVYRIVWFIEADDDIGAAIGDDVCPATFPDVNAHYNDPNDFVHRVACYVASTSQHLYDADGFYWETKREANDVLRQIKADVKIARSSKPWPEWARTALAAGWKAPKGWQP